MNYKTYIFDQDGTLYSSTTNLGVKLSEATKKWLCHKENMDNKEFDLFKRKNPDFVFGLNSINLDLNSWHEEVQKPLIPDVDRLLDSDLELAETISGLRNCFLVTFSSECFSEAVLNRLGINCYFKGKFRLKKPGKGVPYAQIQLMQNHSANETLVIGDNLTVDLHPAEELGMSTLLIDPRRNIVSQIRNLLQQ